MDDCGKAAARLWIWPRMAVKRWATTGLALAALVLAGCGGGGGDPGADGTLSPATGGGLITYAVPALTVQSIEGAPAAARVTATLGELSGDVYLYATESKGLVTDGAISETSTGIAIDLAMSDKLVPGLYDGALEVFLCKDEKCVQPYPGSPFKLPIRYEVLAQVKLGTFPTLQRSGSEPAPSATLAFSAPAAAGNLSLSVRGDTHAISATLEGNQVRVRTEQVRAGSYIAELTLVSPTDPRFTASTTVRYEVQPPVGGELPLRVLGGEPFYTVPQGTLMTQKVKVLRPSWTDAEPTVRLVTEDGVVTAVRALGQDEFELTIDTRGRAANQGTSRLAYGDTLLFSVGNPDDKLAVPVRVAVGWPLTLGVASLSHELTAQTTGADLSAELPLGTPDGEAVGWSASVDVGWLRLTSSRGTTGRGVLAYTLDPGAMDLSRPVQQAVITITLDRPGTLPVGLPVVVGNKMPVLQSAAVGALTSRSATVYFQGRFPVEGGVLAPGVLSASGATLRESRLVADSRYVGDINTLALTLDDIQPGQAVTVSARTALGQTSVVLPSLGAVQVPSGFVRLPYDPGYRPPTYAPLQRAVVFAGTDKVWQWRHDAAAWAPAAGSAALPGLVDATYRPDELEVVAASATGWWALDPVTLAVRRQSLLADVGLAQLRFVGTTSPDFPMPMAALRFDARGHALAGMAPWADGALGLGGVKLWSGCDAAGVRSLDVVDRPCLLEPGEGTWNLVRGGSGAVGMVRSTHGGRLLMADPGGPLAVYQGVGEGTAPFGSEPAGTAMVAVDDSGRLGISHTGSLHLAGAGPGGLSLSALVGGAALGGWGLTGDGRLAVAYGYTTVDEGGVLRARNPRLWLVSLANLASPAVVGEVGLPEAVGCNAEPQPGEPCAHWAHVLVTPGDRSVVVLGPRGVAAVALPDLGSSLRVGPAARPAGFTRGLRLSGAARATQR